MYQETRIPRLRAALWVSTPEASVKIDPAEVAPALPPGPSLIVPDGCMDLIVIDTDVVIAGADSTARLFRGASTPTVGLRFDPGVLPQLLATSAAELADQVTSLDAVIVRDEPANSSGFASLVGFRSAADPVSEAGRLLRIAEALTSQAEIDTRPLELAHVLNARQNTRAPDIAEVAAEFAYSPRQLRRLSAEWFGYGPKHLSKVLRWQAARALIDAGSTRTAAATGAGYADAAHLWRDERSLLGR